MGEGPPITLANAIKAMNHNADRMTDLAIEIREARFVACLLAYLVQISAKPGLDDSATLMIVRLLTNRYSWLKYFALTEQAPADTIATTGTTSASG